MPGIGTNNVNCSDDRAYSFSGSAQKPEDYLQHLVNLCSHRYPYLLLYLLISKLQLKINNWTSNFLTHNQKNVQQTSNNASQSLTITQALVFLILFLKVQKVIKIANPNIQPHIQLCVQSDDQEYKVPAQKCIKKYKKDMEQATNLYEVEKVMKKKIKNGQPFYLVKWKNFSIQEATWEPFENIAHLRIDLELLERQSKRKTQTNKKRAKLKNQNIRQRNQQKISEFFSQKQNDSLLLQPEKDRKYNLRFTPLPERPDERCSVKIIDKISGNNQQTKFKMTKGEQVFELTQKQTKLLFPVQLSLYYEDKYKKQFKLQL